MIAEYIIISLLVLGLILTVVYQLFTLHLAPWARRWDVCRVLPSYRLFASLPHDWRLYYRVDLGNGRLTPWQAVELGLYSRCPWRHAVWHPQLLVSSVALTLVDDMARLADKRGEGQCSILEQTVTYRGMVHVVRHLSQNVTATARQFKIEEAYGHVSSQPPRVVFTSTLHAP